MRVKIVIVAEDHQHGIKSTQEGYIDVPSNMVESSANPKDAVKSCARMGLQQAHRAVGAAIYGQQPQQPQPPQQPPQMPPGAPQGAPPQQQGDPAQRGSLPRTEREILEQSEGPMRQAINADRQQPQQPGPGPIGFGPHRGR